MRSWPRVVARRAPFCDRGRTVLAGFQDAFVALVADGALRRRFAADPDAALDAYQLDERARAALRAIPVESLDKFARALIAKRWHELARVVPLTRRVSPRLRVHHREWALEHPTRARDTTLPPGVAEALRAETALRDVLAGEGEAPYAADLWMLEVRRAAARVGEPVPELASRFSIVEIAAQVHRGLLPVDPPPRPMQIRFERRHA